MILLIFTIYYISNNTDKVTMQIIIDGEINTIKIHLFTKDLPKTSTNFIKFCTGIMIDNKIYTYKNTIFHRIVPGFIIQGGDIIHGNGYGSISIFNSKYFDDESFKYKHNKIGMLAMANSGKNTNGSQFYITLTKDLSYLDNKHVVFGEVIEGLDVLQKIVNANLNNKKIMIDDCYMSEVSNLDL